MTTNIRLWFYKRMQMDDFAFIDRLVVDNMRLSDQLASVEKQLQYIREHYKENYEQFSHHLGQMWKLAEADLEAKRTQIDKLEARPMFHDPR